MVDKVKPLKIENAGTGGAETDVYPTEADPTEDYLSAKGISFGGSDDFLHEILGRALVEKHPALYQSITYVSNNVTSITYYNSASFITANRIAKSDMTYSSNNLTQEILTIYDTNGTSILRTYTYTHTYVSNNYESTSLVLS